MVPQEKPLGGCVPTQLIGMKLETGKGTPWRRLRLAGGGAQEPLWGATGRRAASSAGSESASSAGLVG